MAESQENVPQMSASEILVNKIISGGINENNECLYDIASLKFKFNKMICLAMRHLNYFPSYDGLELELILRDLNTVFLAFTNEVNLHDSPGVSGQRQQRPQSTPIPTPIRRSNDQSTSGNLYATPPSNVYVTPPSNIYLTPVGRSYEGEEGGQPLRRRNWKPEVRNNLNFSWPDQSPSSSSQARASYSEEFQAMEDFSAELRNMIPHQASTPLP